MRLSLEADQRKFWICMNELKPGSHVVRSVRIPLTLEETSCRQKALYGMI
jgi:hypothetical protein